MTELDTVHSPGRVSDPPTSTKVAMRRAAGSKLAPPPSTLQVCSPIHSCAAALAIASRRCDSDTKGGAAMRFTRGFRGRGQGTRDSRLPPGQYDVGSAWPVLTAEPTPKLSTESWKFTVRGLVEQPTTWTWDQIHALAP